jgi:sugar phosphate isomerase/epimerase
MYKLGINTGFAVNRYSGPEDWAEILNKVEVEYVQFTADLLNVSLPDDIIKAQTKRIIEACKNYNIKVTSTFTGAFTRVNHLAHPDPEIRKYWINWFKRFANLTIELGSVQMGSHFGILTAKDDLDSDLRQSRVRQNIEGWHEIADYAKKVGIETILWEPMSISREQGETIERCRILQNQVNLGAPLPFKLCLDVDHGDVSSPDPKDTDPYAWLEEFAQESPVIHLKQSLADKGGHWPFTAKYNENGKIKPDKVIDLLRTKEIIDVDLVLELSFRERQPADSSVVEVLKESVSYWKKYLN